MTATSDLRWMLNDLTVGMDRWQWQFEIDAEGWWWLTCGGRRSQRMKWRPADEVDVMVAVTLLHL